MKRDAKKARKIEPGGRFSETGMARNEEERRSQESPAGVVGKCWIRE